MLPPLPLLLLVPGLLLVILAARAVMVVVMVMVMVILILLLSLLVSLLACLLTKNTLFTGSR